MCINIKTLLKYIAVVFLVFCLFVFVFFTEHLLEKCFVFFMSTWISFWMYVLWLLPNALTTDRLVTKQRTENCSHEAI